MIWLKKLNMKTYFKVILFSDIIIAITAALFAEKFVIYSVKITGALFGFRWSHIAFSYGAIIAMSAFIFSLVRRCREGTNMTVSVNGKKLPFEIIVLSAATIFIYTSIDSNSNITASDVVSPYIGYLLSIVICLGFGYMLSDIVIKLTLRRK